MDEEKIRLENALNEACKMISQFHECPLMEKEAVCEAAKLCVEEGISYAVYDKCDDEAECWKKYFLGDMNG